MSGTIGAGDKVRLKSGGPEMVVEDETWAGRQQVTCLWFENGATRRETFGGLTLRKVDDERAFGVAFDGPSGRWVVVEEPGRPFGWGVIVEGWDAADRAQQYADRLNQPTAAMVDGDPAGETTESTGDGSRDSSPASPPRDGAGDRGGGVPGDGPPPPEHDERAVREAEERLGVHDKDWTFRETRYSDERPKRAWVAFTWDHANGGRYPRQVSAFGPVPSVAVLALDEKVRAEGLYGEEPRPEPDEAILAHEPGPEDRVRELMRSWHFCDHRIEQALRHLRRGLGLSFCLDISPAGREKILAVWKGEAPR